MISLHPRLLLCSLVEGTLKPHGNKTRSRGPTGHPPPPGSAETGPLNGSTCAISGWCKDSGPCEGGVKASLPFHGALLWPFHWVKPKEIHVHDLCGASLHSGTVRGKKRRGIGNEKGRPMCAQDTRPLNSNLYKASQGRGWCGIWLEIKYGDGQHCLTDQCGDETLIHCAHWAI